MNNQIVQEYRKARGNGLHMQTASRSLHEARTLVSWHNADGAFVDPHDYRNDPESDDPRVRIAILADEVGDLSYLKQDCFADMCVKEYERANRDGMWGMVGQFWDGDEWQDADSAWGFIGDDFRGSGYDTDIMRATLDAYAEHLTAKARELEASRPDMYGEASA